MHVSRSFPSVRLAPLAVSIKSSCDEVSTGMRTSVPHRTEDEREQMILVNCAKSPNRREEYEFESNARRVGQFGEPFGCDDNDRPRSGAQHVTTSDDGTHRSLRYDRDHKLVAYTTISISLSFVCGVDTSRIPMLYEAAADVEYVLDDVAVCCCTNAQSMSSDSDNVLPLN